MSSIEGEEGLGTRLKLGNKLAKALLWLLSPSFSAANLG